ncbi:protein of unknown function [uncultured Woeseiaceae bacterium]|uniref:Uncharacterized protein n=1 Tax=uncultured Woeseiaceae bacterium TaxID=1983305 RepID=A0A7D9H3E5_9GAMM|nr:protein of unknown function [uncultured Woeseiaceae bacterium]
MMQHSNSPVLSIPDELELLLEIRQREVAIIYQISGLDGYAQSLWFAVRTLPKSQISVLTAWQSQITEINFVRFRNRPEVRCCREAQSQNSQDQ